MEILVILFLIALILFIIGIVALHELRFRRLRNKCKDDDWELRKQAIRQANEILERDPEDRIIRLLTETLHDSQWQVRREVALTIADKINASVIKETNQGRRTKRPIVSSKMRPVVLTSLRQALRDRHPNVRKEAARALGNAHDSRNVRPLIHMLKDDSSEVRSHAVCALGKIGDPRAIPNVITALSDMSEDVRQEAALALGKAQNITVVKPLLRALQDQDLSVRKNAVLAFQQINAEIYALVFGRKGMKIVNERHTVCDPDLSALKVPLSKLRQIIICTLSCDIRQLEAFTYYMEHSLDAQYLKKYVTVRIYGNFKSVPLMIYNAFTLCKMIDVSIETIIFGKIPSQAYSSLVTLDDPDFSDVLFPFSHIKQVMIHTETYNFHHVERFLTYALDYLGQKYLKKHINIHIYGNPEKLHTNLYNSLTNFCKHVHLST